MRLKLQNRRKELGITVEDMACKVGMSEKQYQAIEQGRRFTTERKMRKIMQLLDTVDVSVFDDEKKTNRGIVTKNICRYMNEFTGFEKFNVYIISAIRASIVAERDERELQNIIIKSKGKAHEGKRMICERVAAIANKNYNLKLSGEDIKLFKTCERMEYASRTGKCTWSIPTVRVKLGYDAKTGVRIE